MKPSLKHTLGLGAFALITSLTSNCVAYAQGDKTGGGGDVLVCQEEGRTNHYLLDMYEAKLKGQLINLGSASLSLKDKIIFAQVRYAEIDPVRADRYAAEALKMLQDIEAQEQGKSAPNGLVALVPQELKDIDDADEIFTFKENCKKFQLVRQEKPVSPRDPFYTIDQTYWSRLNADQKVATLYHEAIYKEMRETGATVSKGARSLNGMIMSGVIQTLKSGEYRDFILSQSLDSYQYLGLFEAKGEVQIGRDGEIESIAGEFPLNLGALKLKVKNPQFSNRQFRSAQVLSTFDLSADQTQIQVNSIFTEGYTSYPNGKGKLSGAVLESITEQKLTLRGLKKDYDGGSMTLTVDFQGKVVTRLEDGYFNRASSREMDQALTDLVRCSKKLIQKKKNPQLAAILLQAARDQIPNEDASLVRQLVDDCKKGNTSINTSATPSAAVSSIVEAIARPTVRECSGKALTVGAGALFGIKVGVTTMTCKFSDGSRHVYFGPHLGFLIAAIGADVMAGEFSFEVNDQTIGKGGAMISSDRDGLGLIGIHIPRSWRGPNYQEQVAYECMNCREIDEGNQFGIGFLGAAWAIEAVPSIKIFRKKDQYEGLVSSLKASIMIDKSK